MKIIETYGRDDVAVVYVGDLGGGRVVEFAESLQPPIPREEKWVNLVSTLCGCPVTCPFCDAGGSYSGKLTAEEIQSQITYLVARRFPDRRVEAKQWKIQFARMGEPSLNDAVLDVLRQLPLLYSAQGLIPSISTVAPAGRNSFFEQLLEIKNDFYTGGRFQLQFSLHTTDEKYRDELVPIRKWSFEEIALYGERFVASGDRRVTINFAAAKQFPVDPDVVAQHFNTEKFLVKITPLNPTASARENGLSSVPIGDLQTGRLAAEFRARGFETIVSVGELEENVIGSNCGQYARKHLMNNDNRLEEECQTIA